MLSYRAKCYWSFVSLDRLSISSVHVNVRWAHICYPVELSVCLSALVVCLSQVYVLT